MDNLTEKELAIGMSKSAIRYAIEMLRQPPQPPQPSAPAVMQPPQPPAGPQGPPPGPTPQPDPGSDPPQPGQEEEEDEEISFFPDDDDYHHWGHDRPSDDLDMFGRFLPINYREDMTITDRNDIYIDYLFGLRS